MDKLNYDDEAAKSLDQKLKDFYARWDSSSKEEKQQMLNTVEAALKELQQTDHTTLSDEELKDKVNETKQIHNFLNNVQSFLGHRIVSQANTIAEHIKRLAEQGNPEAQKAWDALKDDYNKNKYDKLTDN